MRSGNLYPSNSALLFLFLFYSIAAIPFCAAVPSTLNALRHAKRADDGPVFLTDADIDKSYLPVQIGGVVGSYGVALVLVAVLLLILSRKRREHLRNGENGENGAQVFNPFPAPFLLQSEEEYNQKRVDAFPYPIESPKSPLKNFSHPLTSPRSPIRIRTSQSFQEPNSPSATSPYSPVSTISHPAIGVDLTVDQSVVARDREMAQQQLEDMYKYVMEQEEAKEQGKAYQGPSLPSSPHSTTSRFTQPGTPGILKKERNKPSNLNLSSTSLNNEDKNPSRGSSFLSMLKSPRRKMKGVNISSPIMTPMSGTFPNQESQEMNPMSPRHYAPILPPPAPVGGVSVQRQHPGGNLPTPEMSPIRDASIDQRIDAAIGPPPSRGRRPSQPHSRHASTTNINGGNPADEDSDSEPPSATSSRSTTNLVGLPTSPKPGVNRFPSLSDLPKSPVPGQSFARFNPPAALRTGGGGLPLRAYEPSLKSPSQASYATTTKQTVFTRAGPMSPGAQTPWTGAPVPYSPYQPFSPVIPITPSLVTRADRKRMRKFEPKTPTVEMVRNIDDIW